MLAVDEVEDIVVPRRYALLHVSIFEIDCINHFFHVFDSVAQIVWVRVRANFGRWVHAIFSRAVGLQSHSVLRLHRTEGLIVLAGVSGQMGLVRERLGASSDPLTL